MMSATVILASTGGVGSVSARAAVTVTGSSLCFEFEFFLFYLELRIRRHHDHGTTTCKGLPNSFSLDPSTQTCIDPGSSHGPSISMAMGCFHRVFEFLLHTNVCT